MSQMPFWRRNVNTRLNYEVFNFKWLTKRDRALPHLAVRHQKAVLSIEGFSSGGGWCIHLGRIYLVCGK